MSMISINDEVFKSADEVLQKLGMDVDMAVNIYLKRIIMENGLPISMSIKKNLDEKESTNEENKILYNLERESNKKITLEMVDTIWIYFKKYLNGLAEIPYLSDAVAEDTGMNRGSAFIYFNVLANLVKGESNTRVIKIQDMDYLMKKIKLELGNDIYKMAIESLEKSVPYWKKKIAGNYSTNVEKYIESCK